MKKLLFLLLISNQMLFGQDTLKYQGFLAQILLIKSIELYPEGTFKWTSEYDLTWSETGEYELSNDTLVLNYLNRDKKETYIKKHSGLIKLDKNGVPVRRVKDKSLRTKWSWLRAYRHNYEIRKV
jgi:predicted TPR repeat methyltransferase